MSICNRQDGMIKEFSGSYFPYNVHTKRHSVCIHATLTSQELNNVNCILNYDERKNLTK
jgi:hypothetical protein